jgi:hypothetical protein
VDSSSVSQVVRVMNVKKVTVNLFESPHMKEIPAVRVAGSSHRMACFLMQRTSGSTLMSTYVEMDVVHRISPHERACD